LDLNDKEKALFLKTRVEAGWERWSKDDKLQVEDAQRFLQDVMSSQDEGAADSDS
jgi:hypothetical protein